MTQLVIDRQRGRGKDPAARLVVQHFAEPIGHRQRRQRQHEVARVAFIPIAVARLRHRFQPLKPRAVQRGAFKGSVQQRRTPQRQLHHVITQLQRVIEQQQSALHVGFAEHVAQIAAKTRLAQIQAKILRAQAETVGAFCS